MKIATPFTLDKNYSSYADEYNILYKKETASLEKLISFCKMYPYQRINIEFEDEIEISHLEVITTIHDQIFVRLRPPQMNQVANLKEKKINFFFNEDFPCYSFALLDSFIAIGVSDIYISDNLCYHMEAVHKECKENGIQIRMILNRIPQLSPDRGMDVRAPIFSPREVSGLNAYVDVCEFDCGDPYDWHKFGVYYKTWFEKEDWFGDLRDINLDLDLPIDIRDTVPDFLYRKFNCGRVCSLGGKCRRCEDWFELNQELASKNFILKRGNFKKS